MMRDEGYRSEWNQYRLIVEVDSDGWRAAVWDNTSRKFVWKDHVEDAETGKALATAKLAESEGIADVTSLALQLQWEPVKLPALPD